MKIVNNNILSICKKDIVDGVLTIPDNIKIIENLQGSTNLEIKKIIMPNVSKIGSGFLFFVKYLDEIHAPNLISIGNSFMYNNINLKVLYVPKLESIGNCFLYSNKEMDRIYAPNLNYIGDFFMFTSENFKYTIDILRVCRNDIYISNKYVDKRKLIRKLNIEKFILKQ